MFKLLTIFIASTLRLSAHFPEATEPPDFAWTRSVPIYLFNTTTHKFIPLDVPYYYAWLDHVSAARETNKQLGWERDCRELFETIPRHAEVSKLTKTKTQGIPANV